MLSPVFHLDINNIFYCYNYICHIIIWQAFSDNSPIYFRGVILHLDLPEFLKKFCVAFLIFILKDKSWLHRDPLKDSSAIPKYFFCCNLAGYLKGYPHKLLLLFGNIHSTGKLLYFNNCKLMYLSMASFQGYFYCDC